MKWSSLFCPVLLLPFGEDFCHTSPISETLLFSFTGIKTWFCVLPYLVLSQNPCLWVWSRTFKKNIFMLKITALRLSILSQIKENALLWITRLPQWRMNEALCLLESTFIKENSRHTLYHPLCTKGRKQVPNLADSVDAPCTNQEMGQKIGMQQEDA